MTQPSLTEMMASWKKMSDEFLGAWGKAVEGVVASPEGQAATAETEKTYVGARAAMAQAAKNAYGPIIEAVGAVPLSEFQRLADQVHTVLLRLDRIDDQLARLVANGATEAPAKRKKAKVKTA
jgi:hypothetical protein